MTADSLRAAFPVLRRTAYLNAGTCGPLPQAALDAGAAALERSGLEGRSAGYYERFATLVPALRTRYAARLGAEPADVALTTSTSMGIATVIAGLDLRPGDEILTAPDEHPGLLGPLVGARERLGVRIRTAPLADLADAAGPATRLIACSHVSWVTGALAPAALADVDVPVLLDGAQCAGAIPVDLAALGCDYYAASGQKWLCGPVGTGMLWVAPGRGDALHPTGLAYPSLDRPAAGLYARPWPDARRFDTPALSADALQVALAAHDVLDAAGWDAVHARGAGLAATLAARLADGGGTVAPRGATTLVAWEDADPPATARRLRAAGVVVRDIPGAPYVRAAVGAWNDESDLDRLLAAL